MSRLILLNKPFRVLSQFQDREGRSTLAAFIHEKGLYPAGRLDYDSEGLMLLTDDGALQHRIAHPSQKLEKTYWVQVEGKPSEAELKQLRNGLVLKDGPTRPARVRQIDAPKMLWPRDPPVRDRQSIPTAWLEIRISEGRNRQVRRMTAAVNLPTLRLVRYSIGDWTLDGLNPGESRELTINMPRQQRAKGRNRRPQRGKPTT